MIANLKINRNFILKIRRGSENINQGEGPDSEALRPHAQRQYKTSGAITIARL